MSALPKRYFTPEEYFLLEDQAGYRSQYVAGEIFSMDGAPPEHVLIVGNIFALLHGSFRRRSCTVFATDLRVSAADSALYTYPDVVALCGEPKFNAHNPPSLLNPQVIFEVLSPSTEAFDRGDKFTRYQKIESLTDYVLVSTIRRQVDHFTRQDSTQWTLTQHFDPEQRLVLAGLQCELPLAEIYERVVFGLAAPAGI